MQKARARPHPELLTRHWPPGSLLFRTPSRRLAALVTMGLMCYVSAAKSDDADNVIVDATTRAERATLRARSPNMEHETSLVMYSYYWIVPLPPPSLYGCGAERLHFILDA